MATKKGTIKKTKVEDFSRPRKGGIIAIGLIDDELVSVRYTEGEQNLIVSTRKGKAIKFSEKDVRGMGRSAKGVRGIRLKKEDNVVGMVVADDDESLLTIAENGYGKRTKISEYRLIGRGGSGVKNMNVSEKTGNVVSIKTVKDEDEMMLISKSGIGIRVKAKDISIMGRATQGVRVMKLKQGDKVGAVAKIQE